MKQTKVIVISIMALISTFLLISCYERDDIIPAIYAWFPEGNVEQISSPDGIFYQASVHPLGTDVLCSGNISGAPHIWKVSLETENKKMDDDDDLGPANASSIHGVFSWDGSEIAFASNLNSLWSPRFTVDQIGIGGTPPLRAILNIYTMNADGTKVRQLTKGSYQDQRPTFSPNGDYIVFVRSTGLNQPSLWIVSTAGDGINVPESISGTEKSYRPWFSKDGKTLYFFTRNTPSGRDQIASMPTDSIQKGIGGAVTLLAQDNEGSSHGPFVDPSGDYLFMHSTRQSNIFRIYRIQLPDGQPELLIPPDPGFNKDTALGHATMSINGVITFDAESGLLAIN